MRSYLSLIPISAKVHRRQNRMTLLCIIFAVFLVTAIFSMADMGIRCETMHAKETHGNWQIQLSGLSKDDAKNIAMRDDVAASSWYETVNLDQSRSYLIDGRQTVLCGIEEPFLKDIMYYFDDTSSVKEKDSVILTPNARKLLNVDVGDRITLETPAGCYNFTVTGFRSNDSRYATNNGGGETSALLVEDDQIGMFLNIATLHDVLSANSDHGDATYYVQFAEHANISQGIEEIKKSCDLDDGAVTQNFILMGLAGLSDNPLVRNIYPLIAVLFLLILLAGVLMISGSLNSTIAQRTQFFGMMRCIGMSRQQVVRFVQLEALNWCKTAVPIGVVLGVLVSWGLGAILHYWVGGEFSEWPIFGISIVGIVSGVVLGVLTVLIAAQSPARRASRVSPMAAVSGNVLTRKRKQHHIYGCLTHIAPSLGIVHATEARKNLLLMSGSFALSIILFLCFSVFVQLLSCLLPYSVAAPDLSIQSKDWSNSIDHALVDELNDMPGVAHAYGRASALDVAATFSVPAEQDVVDLISYENLQLDWLPEDDMLRDNSDLSKVYGDQNGVLAIWDVSCPLEPGDTVTIGDHTVTVVGMLKYSPFTSSGSTEGSIDLICSEETFETLTNQNKLGIIDVQLDDDATDEEVAAIQERVDGFYKFVDRRDEGDRATFWAFSLFIYGFLIIIALITIFNIVNSISMSVTARTKQYGAMRAVGMDVRQLIQMIAAEAATYAVTGCTVGIVLGLPLHKELYDKLITAHFPYYTWDIPYIALFIIIVCVVIAVVAAVIMPAKRMRNMAINEIINEL